MPKSPWRCSQCGTVNEPVANSCRTCGRWPSLFDLQESAVDEGDAFEPEEFGVDVGQVDPEQFEPEQFEPERFEPEPFDDGGTTEAVGGSVGQPPETVHRPGRGARQLLRLIIPVGVLLYFLISSYFSNH